MGGARFPTQLQVWGYWGAAHYNLSGVCAAAAAVAAAAAAAAAGAAERVEPVLLLCSRLRAGLGCCCDAGCAATCCCPTRAWRVGSGQSVGAWWQGRTCGVAFCCQCLFRGFHCACLHLHSVPHHCAPLCPRCYLRRPPPHLSPYLQMSRGRGCNLLDPARHSPVCGDGYGRVNVCMCVGMGMGMGMGGVVGESCGWVGALGAFLRSRVF